MELKKTIKPALILLAVLTGVTVFLYPFPGTCLDCPLLMRLSGFLFHLFGLTTFFLPTLLILFLFHRQEKFRKIIKLTLLLWIPVQINLSLIRDLLEIKENLGGLAEEIFIYAHDKSIDFLGILIPILVIDLLVVHLLGFNVIDYFKKLTGNSKNDSGEHSE